MRKFNYKRDKKKIDWIIAIVVTMISASILSYFHHSNLYMLILSEEKNNWYILNSEKNLGANLYTKLVRKSSLVGHESNVITLNTFVDSKGIRLQKNCKYILTGSISNVLWWDVAAYDDDKKIIISRELKLSVDSIHEGLNNLEVVLGGTKDSDSWIPLGGLGSYQIQVRLYLDSTVFMKNYNELIEVPLIKKISCRGGRNEK